MTRGRPTNEAVFVRQAATALVDPAMFAATFLKDDLWPLQQEIIRAIATDPLVSVKACHASGKTYLAAQAALWWIARYPEDGMVVTTAPTWNQVEKLLWGEVHTSWAKSAWPFPKPTNTELKVSHRNFAMGLSTDEGDRFQGFHGTILIIIDEATGVRQSIFEAIEGIRAGGKVHVLMLGNPTVAAGRFFDAFKSPLWTKFTIDAFDTPNFDGVTEDDIAALPSDPTELTAEQVAWLDVCPRPYLITRRFVWEKYNDWGPDSPIYQSRVRGRFPTDGANMFFPFWMVEEAREEREADPTAPINWGLDVAGPGEDETVLYWRQGMNIAKPGINVWSIADPRHAVVTALKRVNAGAGNADSGGLGFHLHTFLRDNKIAARAYVAQSSARDKDRFLNLKAELHWMFRQKLEARQVGGLRDQRTIDQLLGILYDDSTGKVAVEAKEHARKKRGLKSPDRAEALILCFADNIVPPLQCY